MANITTPADWAEWAVQDRIDHPEHWVYSEGPERMSAIGVWPIKFPVTADCSAACTLWYWLTGRKDPNNMQFNHTGYTGTLLSHNQHIPIEQVQRNDLVVYGPGTGWHVAIVVEVHGKDILTVSHGEQGDPSYVWVNTPSVPSRGHAVDGRNPQTFLRPDNTVVRTVHSPADLSPKPAPAPAPAPTLHPTVKQGDNGPNVVAVQNALNAAGYHLKVDGIFGALTFQSVKDFQSHHKLIATGVVSDATWPILLAATKK